MKHNLALRLSGLLAMGTALYHGIEANALINAMDLSAADLSVVGAFTQIGTMGWMAGGVLLIAAASMQSQKARNWIVGVFAAVYGLPAFGTIVLTGGQPSLGGILLAIVVVLAVFGRVRRDETASVAAFA